MPSPPWKTNWYYDVKPPPASTKKFCACAPPVETGHKTLAEVQRYIAEANRELMADAAMNKLMARPNGKQTVVNLTDMFANNSTNH